MDDQYLEAIERAKKELSKDEFANIFRKAMRRVFPEMNSNPQPTLTIKGWLARDGWDGPGNLFVHSRKPIREQLIKLWRKTGEWQFPVSNALAPELKWEDNPVEVEVIIRRK